MVEGRVHHSGSRLYNVTHKYTEGDFIGESKLDSGRSFNIETWNFCNSDVEIVSMS